MEPKRPVSKRWRKLVSHLLVLAIIAVALFEAWQSFCAIPTDMSFSQDFSWSVVLSDPSEVDLLGLVQSEMSKELARLGSIVVGPDHFRSQCQRDSCALRDAILHMRIAFFPLCACKNGVSGQATTVFFSDFAGFYIRPLLAYTVVAENRRNQVSFSDITIVKELAMKSIEDDVWHLHPELILHIYRSSGDWVYSIKSGIGSPDYSRLVRLEDSDIQRIKEERQ